MSTAVPAPTLVEPRCESQQAVLQLIIDGVSLADVLRHICELFESLDDDLKCSIALFDANRRLLGPVVTSRLPQAFALALEGSIDVPGRGSDAAAVVRNELVIAEKTATDPLWNSNRALALAHGLQASWSLPVWGSARAIVAVFTAYHPLPKRPSAFELQSAERVAGLAAIAISYDRAQQALRENETRLDLTQGIARLGYWERHVVAGHTLVTDEFRKLVGFEADAKIELSKLLDRVIAEDRPVVLAAYQEVSDNSPELSPVEFRVSNSDGSIRHLLAQRRAFRDDTGRTTKVIGTVQDVTQQRQAAAHLQESEERFRMVAEHTGQLIVDCRLAAGEVHCAGAIREILGNDLVAAHPLELGIWRKIVHPEDVGIVEQAIRQVLRGGRVSVECRIQRFDGVVLDIEATGSAVINDQGWATRIIATVSNITERRRAEAERQRYLAQLAFLADAARKVNSVLSVGELLRIITDIARDLVGAHVAIGVLLPDEGWPDGLQRISAADRYSASEVEHFTHGLTVSMADLLSDGSELRPVRRARAAMTDDEQHDRAAILEASGVLTVPLRTSAGAASGVIRVADKREGDFGSNDERVLGQLADLASVGIENARLYAELEARVRRRTQELEQSNRELEAFSYSVSHDLRGPLRAISGFAGLLREHHYADLEPDSRHYLDRIQAGTLRMSGLIDDLLELGRVTRMELRREPVDLSALAENVVLRMRERAPERVVNFAVEPGHRVHGDWRLLEIALENLFDNAWKFTAERPVAEIRFGIERLDDEPAFFVRDNGVGFDPRFASNLFGVFQRLHSTSDFPGTGVGLATVQRIVQRHGGKIWADAEVGQGAAFYFTIAGSGDGGSIHSSGRR